MKKLIGILTLMLFTISVSGQAEKSNKQHIVEGPFGNITYASEHLFDFADRTNINQKDITNRINAFTANFNSGNYAGLRLTTYSFVKEGKLYMLSYDTLITFSYVDKNGVENKKVMSYNEDVFYDFKMQSSAPWRATRDLYLFCWSNNEWSKASDVVRQDYWLDESILYNAECITADTYFPRMDAEGVKDFGSDNVGTYVKELNNGSVVMKVTYSIIGNRETESKFYSNEIDFIPKSNGMYSVYIPNPQMKPIQ